MRKWEIPQITEEDRKLEETTMKEKNEKGWEFSHGFAGDFVYTDGKYCLIFDKTDKIHTKYRAR